MTSLPPPFPLLIKLSRRYGLGLLSLLVLLFWSGQFYHSDLAAIAYKSHYVALGEFNVYAAIARDNPSYLENVTYPPFIYWAVGAWIRVGHELFGYFGHLYDGGWSHPIWLRSSEAIWLRLLYLPFVLLLPAFLMRGLRLVGIQKLPRRETTFFVWAQPILLFVTFIVGQFDIIPTSLSVIGVVLILEGAAFAGMLALAVGILFKNFPAVFLVIVGVCILAFHQSRRERLRALGGMAAAIATVLAVFWLVAGEPFAQSYGRLSQHGRTMAGIIINDGSMPVTGKYYLFVLLVVCALALPGVAGKLPEFWRGLVRSVVFGMSPLRLNRLVFFGCVASSGLIFFDRLWWTQYVLWSIPWFLGFLLYLSAEHNTRAHWLGWAAFNIAYVLTALAMFPGQNHYFRGVNEVRVGELLHLPGWIPWVFVSTFCSLQLVLALRHAFEQFLDPEGASLSMPAETRRSLRNWSCGLGAAFIAFMAAYWIAGSNVLSYLSQRLF